LPDPVYLFGEFRLDCNRFELTRNGRSLRIERKPMELLILLAENSGRLVTRAEIIRHLWGKDVFVDTEHGINTAIRKIRHVLGDDSDRPHFVQTVTGKGYVFSAAILPEHEPPQPPPPAQMLAPLQPPGAATKRGRVVWWTVAGVFVLLLVDVAAMYRSHLRKPEVTFTQLTDLADSAVSPTLSPDGRTVAFIGGGNDFLSSDPIYVKALPDGEAHRVTQDIRPKYGLAFSLDGSKIAYTVMDPTTFSTYIVPAAGGEPQLFLRNAAGLNWLSPSQLLFSRIQSGSGIHLGLVTGNTAGGDLRDVYLPSHERGMAHYSYPSPDRKWVIVVEMNGKGEWAPCRLVSLDGHNSTQSVGPTGPCTSAGWAPDGSWMYFTAVMEGRSHLWRQPFPIGTPEQVTFGPTEEKGIAVEKTGRSVITSAGLDESSLWIHDDQGDRPLSPEGQVISNYSLPTFTQDDQTLYYLLAREAAGSGAELWRTVVRSGISEAVFPGVAITAFDVSPDGRRVVYATAAPGERSQLWVAPVDRSSPALKVGDVGGTTPHFGAQGQIFFVQTDGMANYIEQMNLDGSGRSRVVPYSVSEVLGISPGRHWILAMVPAGPDGKGPGPTAISLDGKPPQQLCTSDCLPVWSSSGKFLFIQVANATQSSPGRTLVIPVGPGEALPAFPPSGVDMHTSTSMIAGLQSLPLAALVPGRDADHFAYVKTNVHRNLYRVSLP
jgi:DNA-binding winged helix-turn-helix (wHTH) protein/Tol biopolymer transport system component